VPTPLVTALLAAGAVVTVLSALAAVIIVAVAVVIELGVFLLLGAEPTDGAG
jgi:hypothetical protein